MTELKIGYHTGTLTLSIEKVEYRFLPLNGFALLFKRIISLFTAYGLERSTAPA